MSRAVYDYDAIDWNSLFYYDLTSKTGLRWKVDRYRGRKMSQLFRRAGDEAGNIAHGKTRGTQYATVNAGGKNHFAHRVIWIMYNGPIDKSFVVDHINGDSLDNRIENLRVVKQISNNRNASLRKDNSTGTCGVYFTTAQNHRGGVYTYASAQWKEIQEGKSKSICKHFSTEKYGLLPAFAMACRYREDRIAELNALGYGYTENHGK